MNRLSSFWTTSVSVAAIVLITACGLGLLLLALNLSPASIFSALANGTLRNWLQFSQVLSIWTPLLLCCCGLLFTFQAGLWNIGIEGQVIMGAIGATLILRLADTGLTPEAHIAVSFLAAILFGGLWGATAGLLKTRGGVNEIFGGLGLNFVAQGVLLYLIFGPWKRAGIASMSGTDIFARDLWLNMPPGWRVPPVSLLLACGLFFLTWLFLTRTRFGLRVKTVGLNPKTASLYRISPARYSLLAIMAGGGLAGLAGGLQVSGVYHRLIPAVSSGYGYLGLLVVMLAGYRVTPVPLIALFFAWLAAGSIQLPIMLQVDSSLSGVIQGGCVVAALLVHGLRRVKRGK